MSLTRYLKHLYLVMVMSYQSATIYRFDFLLRILRPIIEIGLTLTLLGAIYQNTTNLNNWTQDEASVLAATALLIGSIVMLIFGNGLEGLHRHIIEGTFDRMLLQPLDAQWLSSTNFIYITNVFRVIFGGVFFVGAVNRLTTLPTLPSWLLFLLGFGSGLVIYYCFMFCASVVSFWALSGELFFLFGNLTHITRFPVDMFGTFTRRLLTVIPLIFIATVPTQALLERSNVLIYLSPFVALISLYLSRRLWFLGLRSYESASS